MRVLHSRKYRQWEPSLYNVYNRIHAINNHVIMRLQCAFKKLLKYSPGQNDEHVEAVPGVGEICFLSEKSHRHDLENHFDGEEGEYEVIEPLEYSTPSCVAYLVLALAGTFRAWCNWAIWLPCLTVQTMCEKVKEKVYKNERCEKKKHIKVKLFTLMTSIILKPYKKYRLHTNLIQLYEYNGHHCYKKRFCLPSIKDP